MIFSIVIPLYNKSLFIVQTLTSITKQTLQDFEVIVVDDGSNDNSGQIAQSFSEHFLHFRCIRQANAGVSAARNAGIAAAAGQWVAFLDADDYWHPAHLQTLSDLIDKYPAADMVATNVRTIPDKPDWSPEPWPPSSMVRGEEIIENLHQRWFQGLPFITSSIAVRTSVLNSMQPCFSVGESNGEDIELWFRLSEVTPIARSNRALLAYREAPSGGLTSRFSQTTEAPYLQRMLERARHGHLSTAKRSAIIDFVGQQRVYIARRLLESGQRADAIKLLAKAWPALFTRRWFSTAVMAVAFPRDLVQRCNQWRYLRKAIRD